MSQVTGRALAHHNAAATNTVVEVSSRKCFVSLIDVFTNSGTPTYLQMFDAKLADVTLGTTPPTLSFPLLQGRDLMPDKYLSFDKGLCYALTAGPNDAVVPAVVGNVNISHF